jgi:ASC-1-like (ASCH) protein/DNA polymerase III delta prime subunit
MEERMTRGPRGPGDNIATGRKTVEGRIHKGIPACIQVGDRIRFQHVVKQVSHVGYYASFWDMLDDVGFENAMPDAHSIEEALEVYHHFPRDEDLAKEHGVCAFWLEEPVATNAELQQWNPEQLRWKALMLEDLERALAAHEAATEGDLDEAREAAYRHNKIRALEGPPGTGKTSIAVALVREAVARGAKPLWAVYTAQLAARSKAKLPVEADVDTCHAAFGFGLEMSECGYNLSPYSLVIVDEFSQLEAWHLQHMSDLRANMSGCMAFGLLGDPYQCAGFGQDRIWHSPLWKPAVKVSRLHQVFRCKDPAFQKILAVLRTSKPTASGHGGTLTVPKIMAHRRAWRGHTPTPADIGRLLRKHPETTFMAITRRGTNLLNELAVQSLFWGQQPIATLPCDVESNPTNYGDDGKLKPATELEPLWLRLFPNMKVFFTRNIDKARDYINGMSATVEGFDPDATPSLS